MVDRHHPGKAPSALLQALADGSCRTIDELAGSLDLTKRQVSNAAAILIRRDYLIRMAIGCFALSDAGLAAAAAGEVIKSGPRGACEKPKAFRDSLRQRAWRSMRMNERFTIHDLIVDAGRPTDRNPTDNLQRYLRALVAAGYVKVAAKRVQGTALTSNGFKLFLLVRNTGPLAPITLSKTQAIHDQNTGEDVSCVRP